MAGNDSYTKTLLHFDGADGSTANFTDASAGTHNFSPVGTAQLDTAQYKFGTASLLLDGDSDYTRCPDSADFTFGTTPFAMDFWVRFSAFNAASIYMIASQATGTDGNNKVYYGEIYDNKFYLGVIASGAYSILFSCAFSVSINTWYHISLNRVYTTNTPAAWAVYINGDFKGLAIVAGAFSASIPDFTDDFLIGALSSNAIEYYFPGWIDEFRVSNGIARWYPGICTISGVARTSIASVTGQSCPTSVNTVCNTIYQNYNIPTGAYS